MSSNIKIEEADPTETDIQVSQEDSSVNLKFDWIPNAFSELIDKELKETLMKWGLDKTLVLEKFRYAGRFDPSEDVTSAIIDFFNDANAQAAISGTNREGKVACPTGNKHQSVEFDTLGKSVVNLDLFDRLKGPEHRLVGDSGYIRKCMDEIYDGASSTNLVTDMLLNEESENAFMFEESEKKELLFQLFKWVCVGGSLNQPEETIQPYLDAVKALYKHLVHVVRNPETQKIEVVSHPYLVKKVDDSHRELFPVENANSMCILIFTPATRSVTYFNSAFIPFLM